MIQIEGHRGSMGTHKENTLEAFREGIESGSNWLELDLRLTLEGEVVIHHDDSIGGIPIDSLTVQEIQIIDKDVPTLQELFDFIGGLFHPNGKTVLLNLEMKWNVPSKRSMEFGEKTVALVKKNGFEKRVAYSSFNQTILTDLQKFDPLAKIGFLSDRSLEELFSIGTTLGAKILSPEHRLLHKREDVQMLKKNGALVIPWTVDGIDRLDQLVQMGVDGVITNYPRKFIEHLR